MTQFYALTVGHLADRINGAGNLNQKPSIYATVRAIRAYQHSIADHNLLDELKSRHEGLP